MFLRLKHFACIILFLVTLSLHAQKRDTTVLFSSTATDFLFGNKQSSKAIDTTLDNIHNYYQTGVLGNMGLSSYSLIALPNTNSTASFFSWAKLNNSNDLFTESGPLYFNTPKVYTKITAVAGQKLEQFFKIVHSQTFKKKLNISLLFNRYSCQGFYVQQQTLTTNLLVSSNYKTTSGRWGYGFYYMFNKLKYQFNGGIANQDSVFTNANLFVGKNLFPVNFTSGTARQNIRTSAINFNTFFRLNKNDSGVASHSIVYETNFQSNYFLYVDGGISDTTNRAQYYNADVASHDSASSMVFSNSLLYKFNTFNNRFVFYGGYKNEIIHFHQFYIDTVSMNHIVKAGFQLQLQKHTLNATADYVVAGFNHANYNLNATYKFDLNNNFYLSAQASTQSKLPDFNLMYFSGTHFFWLNNFSPVGTQNATLSLTSRKYKFYGGVFTQQQQNQIYFNTIAIPIQYNGNTNITRFFVGKDLRLGHIHFNNNINYQTTPNTNIIRLPNWVTTHQLYYEGKLFDKNLWLQVGFQARYISSYMANAYMPATNQFYLQNDRSYGNYVFVDFFISAEIKPVKFFVMAQHINQGFSGANYILTPNYPMPDRSIKCGLIWMLFD